MAVVRWLRYRMPMRCAFFLPILLAIALLGCSTSGSQGYGVPVRSACGSDPAAYYFPVGTFGGSLWEGRDEFVRRWYSSQLSAMEEPSLSCGALQSSESYRFVWLRTFHNPVAVRILRRGEEYYLEAVVASGAGGYEPGQISQRIARQISREQWDAIVAAVEGLDFWQMPTQRYDTRGRDGAQWIVEARTGGRYHMIDRWSGEDGSESVGRVFLDVAGLTSSVGPIY